MVSRKRQRRWAVVKTVGFSVWMAIVALVLLWQTASYRGVMALIGEWQFDAFGRQYPTFNYVLLVFLLCLPGYLLFLKPRKRAVTEQAEAATFRSARTLLKAIIGGALGLGAAAIVVLIVMLFLPSSSGEPQRLDLSHPMISVPREGPTILSGAILYERTAGFDEDLLLTRRTYRFAPIVAARGGADVQFFVQLPPVDDRSRAGTTTMAGVLKRDGLPGELVRLFRYAGFEIAEPNYVLFVEPAAMRWPYLMAMLQLAIGALFALVVALLQRRRVRRIDHLIHPQPTTEAPQM